MDATKLKGLQVRKTNLEGELKNLQESKKEIDKKISEINNSLSKINTEMRALNEQGPSISEHAMLRYVERVLGVDLVKIRQDILTEANVKIIDQLRTCKLPLNQKHKAVVKNKVVITIEDL